MDTRGRFKRSLFGYAPRVVDQALAERDEALGRSAAALIERAEAIAAGRRRIEHLESVCDVLCERVVGRERELAATRAEAERLLGELERLHQRGDAATGALEALASELEGLRRQARGQATRIRIGALRDAAALSGWIAELSKRPDEARASVIEAIERAIERVGAGAEDDCAEAGPPADGAGRGRPGDVFDGLVEVEVGPLDDFSQLVGFEDAAGGITAASQISVKRFAAGRATLEMRLDEPVELLRELEQRSPFEFRVRDRRFDRLVLDLAAGD